MATSKSISRATKNLAAKLPKGMTAQELKDLAGVPHEMVKVQVLAEPYMKAPERDPYLKADTVTSETVSVCGYQLPPILRGIEPCHGKDYDVKIVWISRRQIEAMMDAVEQDYPQLALMLEIMKAFMIRLDTIRDESKFGIAASLGWIKEALPADSPAISNLDGVMKMLGRWNDENRLMLY